MSERQSEWTTRNELSGESGNTVQAGNVFGGVHFMAADRQTPPPPRQLPMNAPMFINRRSCIEQLDALLSRETNMDSGRVIISAIAGPPGVGKTALALHWAHRIKSKYVDGHLYVNMRGYGAGGKLETGQALQGFLRALHATPEAIPADDEGRAAMYRSMLNGKRMLILIDDATKADEVRPLLPASPGCVVIVTSRNILSGLVAREGAARMVLDVLPPAESMALLKEIIGSDRAGSESIAAAKITEMCAHLPLALRIMGERINTQRFTTLTAFSDQLKDERNRLNTLGIEDDELTDVRAVFSSSYRSLSPAAARMFRLLGLHPGPEVSIPAAAALAGLETSDTSRVLGVLTHANLLQATSAGRFRLHDLLRVYAAECAEHDESRESRSTALRRVLAWYLETVTEGRRVVLPSFHEIPMESGSANVQPLSFISVDEAMQWFETERLNLLDAQRAALRTGNYGLAWRFPAIMYGIFELRSYWDDWQEMHRLGIEAAQAVEDRYGLACNYLGLGDAHWLLGRLPEALECYRKSASLGSSEGDGWVEGFSLRQIGTVLSQQGHVTEAAPVTRQAITVFRAHGERRGEGMALLSLANHHLALGEGQQAIGECRQALTIFQELGDRWSVAWGQYHLARAYSDAEDQSSGIDVFRQALAAFRAFGDRRNELLCLVGLAEAQSRLSPGATSEYWTEAARLAAGMEASQVADVRDRIDSAMHQVAGAADLRQELE